MFDILFFIVMFFMGVLFGFMELILVGDLGFGFEFFIGFGLLLLFICLEFRELFFWVDFFRMKFSFLVFFLVIVIFFDKGLYFMVMVVIL